MLKRGIKTKMEDNFGRKKATSIRLQVVPMGAWDVMKM